MSDADPQPGADRGSATTTAGRVRRGLDYALLGGMVLLGAFAALQFYFAADRTINVWVTREYRPPFKMVFNLVVLLVVGVGVSRQIQRLTASEADGGSDGSDGSDAGDDAAPEATADSGVTANSSAPGTGDPSAPGTGNTTTRDDRGGVGVSSEADSDASPAAGPPAASGDDGDGSSDGDDEVDGDGRGPGDDRAT